MGDRLGTLAVGAIGDAAVFRLHEGRKAMTDSMGKVEEVGRWPEPVQVVKDGRVVKRVA